jgi:hypothetical protein
MGSARSRSTEEPLDRALALKDEAPAILPGHHIAPSFAPRLPEVLGPGEALALHEPQAEALEIQRRELLERERMRGARHWRLRLEDHGVSRSI